MTCDSMEQPKLMMCKLHIKKVNDHVIYSSSYQFWTLWDLGKEGLVRLDGLFDRSFSTYFPLIYS